MKKENDKTQIYDRELNFLEKAKEIEKNPSLTREDLLKEFKQLRKKHHTLLKQTIKITRIGDANHRKLMRLWKLEQEKLQLAQIVKERTEEIEEKNRQLEKQSEKLHEMDRLKSRFFANISHEFRTPLSLIIGPLEQIRSDYQDGELKRKVNLMLRNSHRLLNLINQLLDLSKLDSGKMKLQVSRQNIIPFLKGVMNLFDSLAVENELALVFFSEEKNIKLYMDSEKLEDVVCNLLINAVKFTPPGGKITLSVIKYDEKDNNYPSGRVEISIRDTGIGIPDNQLTQIFDRFYQVEGTGEFNHKGTGIGLALAKELVILHHGDIAVRTNQGEGTEFIISLPRGHASYKPEEILDREAVLSRKASWPPAEIFSDPEADAPVKEGHEPEQEREFEEPGASEKDIILLAEDNVDARRYIKETLAPHYRVEEAENGKEAIEKAVKILPDLIISDIMMPGKDGYQVCHELKNDIKTSHIPVILLTARTSEESIVRGLKTGADAYITKPFSTKILLSRISNLIELRCKLQAKIRAQVIMEPGEISVSSLDLGFIKDVRKITEAHLSDSGFTLKQMAEKLYMSQPTLFRKLKAVTGETPVHFIRSYRLNRALLLLEGGFGNVTEVAFAVGFSNSAYFTKCFKEKFNRLPSDYRAARKT
ncbi:ATP-binding protein [Acidobacteriota bacterium]